MGGRGVWGDREFNRKVLGLERLDESQSVQAKSRLALGLARASTCLRGKFGVPELQFQSKPKKVTALKVYAAGTVWLVPMSTNLHIDKPDDGLEKSTIRVKSSVLGAKDMPVCIVPSTVLPGANKTACVEPFWFLRRDSVEEIQSDIGNMEMAVIRLVGALAVRTSHGSVDSTGWPVVQESISVPVMTNKRDIEAGGGMWMVLEQTTKRKRTDKAVFAKIDAKKAKTAADY